MSPSVLCAAILAVSNLSPQRARVACEHAQALIAAAEANGINPRLLAALVWRESRWAQRKVGASNEIGFTQQLPQYMRTRTRCKVAHRHQFNGRLNLEAGAHELRRWLKRAGGDWARALAHYNQGNKPRARGKRYARQVLKQARRYGWTPRRARISAEKIKESKRCKKRERQHEQHSNRYRDLLNRTRQASSPAGLPILLPTWGTGATNGSPGSALAHRAAD